MTGTSTAASEQLKESQERQGSLSYVSIEVPVTLRTETFARLDSQGQESATTSVVARIMHSE